MKHDDKICTASLKNRMSLHDNEDAEIEDGWIWLEVGDPHEEVIVNLQMDYCLICGHKFPTEQGGKK